MDGTGTDLIRYNVFRKLQYRNLRLKQRYQWIRKDLDRGIGLKEKPSA